MKLKTLACVLGTFLATHPVYAQLVTDALLPCSINPHQLTISDQGWRLWPDTQAPWQNDTLYLPSEVNLGQLPVNAPTGGWGTLNPFTGISVSLPASVEEYYWGKFSSRPYTSVFSGVPEYVAFGSGSPLGADLQVSNGAYRGVSWFWRYVNVPAFFSGKEVTLHLRSFRQRVEVYVNQQLVGYSLIAETAYDCDISKALRPGQRNQIAIRITNPGGNYDWYDPGTLTWGTYTFHAGQGVGGLDRGLTLRAHDSVHLSDAWVLNTQQITSVKAYALLQNDRSQSASATVRFSVIDPQTGTTLATADAAATIPANESLEVSAACSNPGAQAWSPDSPCLYRLRVELLESPLVTSDQRDVTFGFRWFTPEGIGTDAVLTLNGERIRLYSALDWGWWGFSGLWLRPEQARKEVYAAKTLGLNMIQFHRDLGKAEALDADDEGGLMRYMEPGGGQLSFADQGYNLTLPTPTQPPIDTSGNGGDAKTFSERYEEYRILYMVRDHRSHPSLMIYCVQNEDMPDLHNERIFRILHEMHAEDPSRTIVLHSGDHPAINQAFYLPYDETIYHDDGTGYSGWWDYHTVGGPGTWQDDLYVSPKKFSHYSDDRRQIIVWGEMMGVGTADNHELILQQIQQGGGYSYDKQDHQQILDAYNRFLDKWDFRHAFPAASDLFVDIGNKSYDFWARFLPMTRLAEATDYFVVSGWESTAIENHSGILDNQRDFKGDPRRFRRNNERLQPVIEPRGLVHRTGEAVKLDLFVLNETNQAHSGRLSVSIIAPSGKTTRLGELSVPSYHNGQFVYQVAQGVSTPALEEEGYYRIRAELSGETGSSDLFVVSPEPKRFPLLKIGVIGNAAKFVTDLADVPGVQTEAFDPKGRYGALAVSGGITHGAIVSTTTPIQGTEDIPLYQSGLTAGGSFISAPNSAEQPFFYIDGLPAGTATVTFKFAEIQQTAAGQRVFDVAINGQTVLHDFDIFAEAGGANVALDKTFGVPVVDGQVYVNVPSIFKRLPADPDALFQAVKVTAGNVTKAYRFATVPYTDAQGLTWQPYTALPSPQLTADALTVVKNGVPLLVLATDTIAADGYAKRLSSAGAFTYAGMVGDNRAPWMGTWVFLREHPAYAGLPSNQCMKWEYQVDANSASGLLVDGKDVDVFAGYSRDHDRNVGAATFTAPLGKGMVLFQAVRGMQPCVYARFITNSLSFLKGRRSP